jgi:hypothetical protein
MRNEPTSIEGRRPKRSKYMIAGRVKVTFRIYCTDAASRGDAISAPSMISTACQYGLIEVEGITFDLQIT